MKCKTLLTLGNWMPQKQASNGDHRRCSAHDEEGVGQAGMSQARDPEGHVQRKADARGNDHAYVLNDAVFDICVH